MLNCDLDSFYSFAVIDKINTSAVLVFDENSQIQDKKFMHTFLPKFIKKALDLNNCANCFVIKDIDKLNAIYLFDKLNLKINTKKNSLILFKEGKLLLKDELSNAYEKFQETTY